MQFTFHAIIAVSAMVSLAAAQGNGLCNLRGEHDTCSGEFSKACDNISGTGGRWWTCCLPSVTCWSDDQ
ncbi:hypothetical protein PG997_000152 [Apiospora hydei]|uniref:Uncharacterized protein n=1 Tax=Apiospora hydei TaxID=1337664 RepID=A0ABR1XA65_9PEZI